MNQNKILARGSEIRHPSGVSIATPLLVPSFSSKGFGFNAKEESEIYNYYSVASEILTESMLVSAYDISNDYLPQITQPLTEITFVDSGGYETSDMHDLSTVFKTTVNKKKWTQENLARVYDTWSSEIPAVFVNYDDSNLRLSIEKQIELAENFLLRYSNQLKTILIKPETNTQNYIQTERVISNLERLKNFNVVGFTEKELGNSILDRMKTIAEIRLGMDDRGMNTPIHVFGSLDPITSPLYFLSGAEIFDGLTWLRFGFTNDMAIYINNSIALEVGIDQKSPGNQAALLMNNFKYLSRLQNNMRKYLLDKNFAMFGENARFFEDSYNNLSTRIRRLK